MQKFRKHSGLSKGEKKLALKMVLVDISFIFTLIGLVTFLIVSLI